jgi:tRNA threonylcarbamoyladenosine biosynthesis protein TsaE
MEERVVLHTSEEAETRAVGRKLADALGGGERIGLGGQLGAGKTCFVRGLAEGLGVPPEEVRSPSFPIFLPYEGGRLPLYHIDLFRLTAADPLDLGLREVLYGRGVAAIEWYECLGEPLEDYLAIEITFVGARTRRLVAEGHGVGYHAMLALLGKLAK